MLTLNLQWPSKPHSKYGLYLWQLHHFTCLFSTLFQRLRIIDMQSGGPSALITTVIFSQLSWIYMYLLSHLTVGIFTYPCFFSLKIIWFRSSEWSTYKVAKGPKWIFIATKKFICYCVYRKDFKPSYGKLGILGSIFPKVPSCGLTTTLTRPK